MWRAVCGAGSFNRALLRATAGLAPPGIAVEEFDVSTLPLYNADLDRPEMRAQIVTALRRAIDQADALLIASPEHNWGPSAVTKNLIDWASRPPEESVLRRKPIALQGVSTGPCGTLRAQLQIRQHLQAQPAYVLPEPQVQLRDAATLFDGDLRLVDDAACDLVSQQLAALRLWAEALATL